MNWPKIRESNIDARLLRCGLTDYQMLSVVSLNSTRKFQFGCILCPLRFISLGLCIFYLSVYRIPSVLAYLIPQNFVLSKLKRKWTSFRIRHEGDRDEKRSNLPLIWKSFRQTENCHWFGTLISEEKGRRDSILKNTGIISWNFRHSVSKSRILDVPVK